MILKDAENLQLLQLMDIFTLHLSVLRMKFHINEEYKMAEAHLAPFHKLLEILGLKTKSIQQFLMKLELVTQTAIL